ncbi:hypothetical protein P3T36_003352 [Kitasatospora sp. MAP12-15]|uniref:hypothetical protein n=1 Tax=unclassified Kitasatospora TaxID=2633591 RepID=UPI0024754F36|nr:hypothetical protein [Kitasatospora sp. MAP12-44]MDH6111329.1 hypothetical protein [Kitasatospora sp. MAP12-44]
MKDILDGLDGFSAADPASQSAYRDMRLFWDLYEVVSEHRSAGGHDQFLVTANLTAASSMTGSPRAFAVHVHRDPQAETFSIRTNSAATFAWAGHWLVGRGADPQALARRRGEEGVDPVDQIFASGEPVQLLGGREYADSRPADRTTRLIENRVRRSRDRYLLQGYNAMYAQYPKDRTWVLLFDRHPRAAGRRFLLQIETVDEEKSTYTIREGAFPTKRQANDWTDQHWKQPLAGLSAVDPATGFPLHAAPAAPPAAPYFVRPSAPATGLRGHL